MEVKQQSTDTAVIEVPASANVASEGEKVIQLWRSSNNPLILQLSSLVAVAAKSWRFLRLRLMGVKIKIVEGVENSSSIVLAKSLKEIEVGFPKFYKELEAEILGEGGQLMGLQFIQLELRLGKNPSRSFRPVKSAEILWQFCLQVHLGFHLLMMVLGASPILEKEKLNGRNFLDWYRNLRIVLRNEQKLHHLEEALPEAPPVTVTAAVRNAYTRRVAEQQEVACLMLDSMTPEIQKNLEDRPAFEIHSRLSKNCLKCQKLSMLAIRRKGQSVSTYVLKMKAYLDQMERLGNPMPLKPKSQARGKGKQRGKGKSKLAYDPKHKIPPPAKKEHPAKDTECHHCHKTGHWKRNCPLYLAELKKNKASASGTSGERADDLLGIIHSDVLLLGNENSSIVKIPDVPDALALFFFNSAKYRGQFLFQCPVLWTVVTLSVLSRMLFLAGGGDLVLGIISQLAFSLASLLSLASCLRFSSGLEAWDCQDAPSDPSRLSSSAHSHPTSVGRCMRNSSSCSDRGASGKAASLARLDGPGNSLEDSPPSELS
ncbi:zinc finger, CCHC-type containing protein [Tanacetum coccineum]